MHKIITVVLATPILFPLAACETTGPRYRNVRSFSEGLAPVQADNRRWGFISEHQKWVIEPGSRMRGNSRSEKPLSARTENEVSSTAR